MKAQHSGVLYTLFTETYNSIGRYENAALKSASRNVLSPSEFHIIECIGEGGGQGRTIGEIARRLEVTHPTVTVAVNKLEKKGCVTKTRCEKDGRAVYITLTRNGEKMNAAHKYFHRKMVRMISEQFNDQEMEILIRCMGTINELFKNRQAQYETAEASDEL